MTGARKPRVSEIVLDASALMAVLREEPGAAAVEAVLDHAAISAVNLSEVQAKLVERGTASDLAWSSLVDLDLEVVDFDAVQARVAGDLRSLTRAQGLSLGDRACLALAQALGLPAMTADRAWAGLEVEIRIRTVR
jgi:PIN domain nuclease of toxin-antitoxin system